MFCEIKKYLYFDCFFYKILANFKIFENCLFIRDVISNMNIGVEYYNTIEKLTKIIFQNSILVNIRVGSREASMVLSKFPTLYFRTLIFLYWCLELFSIHRLVFTNRLTCIIRILIVLCLYTSSIWIYCFGKDLIMSVNNVLI